MGVLRNVRSFMPFSRAATESTVRTHIPAPEELQGQVQIDELRQIAFVNDSLKQRVDVLQWLTDVRETYGLQQLQTEWVPLSVVAEKIAHAHHVVDLDDESDDEDMRSKALDLLKWGGALGASDIHIRVLARFAIIEVRLDGQLLEGKEITVAYADKLMRALYNLSPSRNATYQETISQDAGISGRILRGTGLDNVRIVRGPCAPVSDNGQYMILRISIIRSVKTRDVAAAKELTQVRIPSGILDLENFGWTKKQSELLQSFILSPTGTIFFTGPPGSGKTFTIHQMSAHRARILPGTRQVFVEQPVELISPWAIQLDIANTLTAQDAGDAYGNRTRQALRMDTNSMVLGEIRDGYVAGIWLEASQGGMPLMTTMHTSGPFEVPPRLRDMDRNRLDFPVICNTAVLSGLVAQRLMPLLCDGCAVKWDPRDPRFPPVMREAVGTWANGRPLTAIRMRGKGCPDCMFNGYSGRRVVAEVVDADETLMGDFIEFGATIARHRYHARSGADTTMLEKAMVMVFDGLVDPFDVPRQIERIRPYNTLQQERERGQVYAGGRH
jgi:general secretion pathway protein E